MDTLKTARTSVDLKTTGLNQERNMIYLWFLILCSLYLQFMVSFYFDLELKLVVDITMIRKNFLKVLVFVRRKRLFITIIVQVVSKLK